MANKREFKKYVGEISTSIVQDMMVVYYNIDKANREGIDKAVIEILKAGEKAIMHANVKFDKSPRAFETKNEYKKAATQFYKSLYKKVNQEFAKEINAAIATFNAAVPKENN